MGSSPCVRTLDLNGNDITILPHGVFESLGFLRTLDLSGNILPHSVFASLGNVCGLFTLDLRGNATSILP